MLKRLMMSAIFVLMVSAVVVQSWGQDDAVKQAGAAVTETRHQQGGDGDGGRDGSGGGGGDPLGLRVMKEKGEKLMMDWVVVAGLPNERLAGGARADGTDAAGLDRDYLGAFGGEAEAVLKEGMVVKYQDEEGGKVWEVEAKGVRRGLGRVVDFSSFVKVSDQRVGYAYGEIVAAEAGKVYAVFGSDDRALVWVNGEQVHAFRKNGRAIGLGDDAFTFEVKRGMNRVMVKVENGMGGWGFAWDLMTKAEQEEMQRQNRLKAKVQGLAWMRILNKGDEGGYFLMVRRMRFRNWCLRMWRVRPSCWVIMRSM